MDRATSGPRVSYSWVDEAEPPSLWEQLARLNALLEDLVDTGYLISRVGSSPEHRIPYNRLVTTI